MNETVTPLPTDVALFRKTAADCQRVGRHFANRQNSDSTLTARECTGLVTVLLNAGNLMAEAADRAAPPTTEEKSCPSTASPPTSPTPPSSTPSAPN